MAEGMRLWYATMAAPSTPKPTARAPTPIRVPHRSDAMLTASVLEQCWSKPPVHERQVHSMTPLAGPQVSPPPCGESAEFTDQAQLE